MRKWFALPALLIAGATLIAPRLCYRGAEDAYEGPLAVHQKMAHGMDRWIDREVDVSDFSTGTKLFDGEWLFGTYLMAGLGYVQTARQHPELRKQHIERAEQCIEAILSRKIRAFDANRHHEDPIDTLDDGDQHAAYLGYLGLLIGALREVHPDTRFAPLHDRIATALEMRMLRSENGLVATYPGEWYPVDNVAVLAAIASAPGERSVVDDSVARIRRQWIDTDTGLLVQSVTRAGDKLDGPRGSGTALAAYFASFFDRQFSSDLYVALRYRLARETFGFGTVREYPVGVSGWGDIDSGPIVFGAGLSATGFSLAGARQHHDPDYFAALWRTAYLWGAPLERDTSLEWVNGGPLGNAIMFAMLTAEAQP